MKNKLIVSLLVNAFAAASAQATAYTEIQGAHEDFFYDSDFWAGSNVSVNGDSISFSSIPGFDVSATATRGTSAANNGVTDQPSSGTGLMAVAHAGYTLSSNVQPGVTGTYSIPAVGGYSLVENAVYVNQGINVAGVFFYPTASLNWAISNPNLYSDGIAAKTGSINQSGSQSVYNYVPFGQYSTLGLGMELGAFAVQVGSHSGTSTTELTSASYSFIATAVPEPEAYAMLLAGLGLMGFMVRRRKA